MWLDNKGKMRMLKKGSFAMNILFFTFGLIIFFASVGFVMSMITKNKNIIKDETASTTDCLYLDFRIDKASHENNTLTIKITNPSSNKYKITKLSIISDNTVKTIDYLIKIGETKDVVFENVDVTSEIVLYANECEGYEKRVMI